MLLVLYAREVGFGYYGWMFLAGCQYYVTCRISLRELSPDIAVTPTTTTRRQLQLLTSDIVMHLLVALRTIAESSDFEFQRLSRKECPIYAHATHNAALLLTLGWLGHGFLEFGFRKPVGDHHPLILVLLAGCSSLGRWHGARYDWRLLLPHPFSGHRFYCLIAPEIVCTLSYRLLTRTVSALPSTQIELWDFVGVERKKREKSFKEYI